MIDELLYVTRFNSIGSGVSEPEVAENRYLPLTEGIALTTVYALTCYAVLQRWWPMRYFFMHEQSVNWSSSVAWQAAAAAAVITFIIKSGQQYRKCNFIWKFKLGQQQVKSSIHLACMQLRRQQYYLREKFRVNNICSNLQFRDRNSLGVDTKYGN